MNEVTAQAIANRARALFEDGLQTETLDGLAAYLNSAGYVSGSGEPFSGDQHIGLGQAVHAAWGRQVDAGNIDTAVMIAYVFRGKWGTCLWRKDLSNQSDIIAAAYRTAYHWHAVFIDTGNSSIQAA